MTSKHPVASVLGVALIAVAPSLAGAKEDRAAAQGGAASPFAQELFGPGWSGAAALCLPRDAFILAPSAQYRLASADPAFVLAATAAKVGVDLDDAQAAIARGDARDVVRSLEDVAELARAASDRRGEAEARGVLGLAYAALGRFDDADEAFGESIGLAKGSNALNVEAKSRFNVANLTLSRSEISLDAAGASAAASRGASAPADEEAATRLAARSISSQMVIASYIDAAGSAARASDALLEARARQYAGRLQVIAGVHAEAVRSLDGAAEILEKANPSAERALIGVGVADAYLFLAEEAPSLAQAARRSGADVLVAAIDDARSAGDDRTESFGRGMLGKFYAASGDGARALVATRQALQLAQTEAARDIAFQWRGQLADIYRRMGDEDRAFGLYRDAVRDIDKVRGSLAAVDPISGRSIFRSVVEPIYLGYADLLLARATGGEADQFLIETRRVLDSLKAVEINQYFQDDCASSLAATSLDRSARRGAVLKNVAILYPIMLPDRLELIVESGGRLARATIPVKPRQIAEAAGQLRKALRAAPLKQADYQTPARALHGWLIAPVEDFLRETSVETIVFAPDAALRGVPVNVLQRPDGRFLIEDYATATAISAALIAEPGAAGGERRALYASLTEARAGFTALPNVAAEIEAARKIFPGPASLSNADFTEAGLSEALGKGRADIVHFATHATFGGRSENSYLLAYGEENSDDPSLDGRLALNEFERMISSASIRGGDLELITLSACETAAGNDQSVLGLAGVAYKSGARAVLASLWAVNDASTSKFVPDIYAAMRDGKSKAQALRAAQTGFIGSGSAYAHPYYWSPFILLGEWE